MSTGQSAGTATTPAFGVAVGTARALAAVFACHAGIERVWIYGSRARGDHRPTSDIDLAVDAPAWDDRQFSALWAAVDDLRLLEGVDLSHWQAAANARFKGEIERDRRLFWQPAAVSAVRPVATAGGFALKDYQERVLEQLDRWLATLVAKRMVAEERLERWGGGTPADEDETALLQMARDFPAATWKTLKRDGHLPPLAAAREHTSRFDGAGRPIPNACLRVPTGGGKTLLAAAAVGRVFNGYLGRDRGLVLWVVPNDAIYRQTLATLKNTDHPYRQMLNVAGAGRVKILEKESPLARMDVESHLCVMVLMLASTARQNKETLRFFRDRGSVLGFLPAEDDVDAHWELLRAVPNLDCYASPWQQPHAAVQKGSIAKSSLGNVVRLLRPMVVIDEGQKAYSETALATIDGFNPSLLLELSATPRVAHAMGERGSNILVDVRGADLDAAEMIKLPIHVEAGGWSDWRGCLTASVERLNALQAEAEALHAESPRYIRPILLVQVERVGKDQHDPQHIHARDVRAHLLHLGFTDAQVREKTSEKDEIAGEPLLSPRSAVRVIITKQALQEGWDCPFAYVLCALAASRAPQAMTQLVGRILRLPHAAKTQRSALNACYVLCHDVGTGAVVQGIRAALEGEGMGDLASCVCAAAGSEGDGGDRTSTPLRRREGLQALRIFVPTVAWVGADGARRPLDYEADIVAGLPWATWDAARLAADWVPGAVPSARGGQRLVLDLAVLQKDFEPQARALAPITQQVDRTTLVAGLLDVVPNPWLVWAWVNAVLARLLAAHGEAAVAASATSLAERLRVDLESARDALAEAVFAAGVQAGRIEFRLRADQQDYELPHDGVVAGTPQRLVRRDGEPMQKSLLAPALRTPDINEFEAVFAGYLDEQPALAWWHRNVARTHYGLQGWKRHRVYPDFVFGFHTEGGVSRVALLETKGDHLAGNADTGYKQALLARLTAMYSDERFRSSGELALEGGSSARTAVECDLVFESRWNSHMDTRWFPAG